MTGAGGVQTSFPIAWLIYAVPKGWQYINFIHFLAPFVVLGIGLDDIFVFTSFFETTRPYAGHFALDTRLTSTFMRASGATLATSTTSAFAFAANIFSPVPAVQSFGLLLATIVVVNYLLVITWLPVCLAVWDRYILQPGLRRAARGKTAGCLGCCLETSAATAANEAAAADTPAPPPRLLEYGTVAWPFTQPPPHHRLAAPPEFREPIRVPGAAAAGGSRRARFFGAAFDLVWRLRWLTIPLVIAVTIAGAIGTARLTPPPTSEPPLFQREHNVQFFWRYSNSDEANNRPTCPTCRNSFADTFRDPVDVINNPGKYFTDDGGGQLIGKAEVRLPPVCAHPSCRALGFCATSTPTAMRCHRVAPAYNQAHGAAPLDHPLLVRHLGGPTAKVVGTFAGPEQRGGGPRVGRAPRQHRQHAQCGG